MNIQKLIRFNYATIAVPATGFKGLQRNFFLVLFVLPSLSWGVNPGIQGALIAAPVESWNDQHVPPSHINVYGKNHDLTTLENPVRTKVLEQLKSDPEQAMVAYTEAVKAGRDVYYSECMQCHGDHLDGAGMFAGGIDPAPPNFREPDRLSSLREAYVFWRITTGGAGLPKESSPWESIMPDYQELLSEEQVWNLVLFLYDRVGQVPVLKDPASAKASNALLKNRMEQRAKLRGRDLYQFYCTVCHGEEGAGDGVAARYLYPSPRDFTIGIFKYKTSPSELEQPNDGDLFSTISSGLPRTGMPPWSTVLSEEQIRSLIRIIKALDTVGTWAPEDAEDEDFDYAGHY